MLVGEVRSASFGSGVSWKLSGGRWWLSAVTKSSKKRQVIRATRRRSPASSAETCRRSSVSRVCDTL